MTTQIAGDGGRTCWIAWWACLLFTVVSLDTVSAMDRLQFRQDGVSYDLEGKVQVKAADGGVMFMSRDGRLWLVQPDEIMDVTTSDEPFEPLTADELAEDFLTQLPEGFRVHKTAHYVVCYNTSEAYAEWLGGLYERLYRGFMNFWDKKGIDLHQPDLPLAVVVFDRQGDYQAYAKRDFGSDPGTIIGYYHMLSNAVVMYDLTGTQGSGQRPRTRAEVNRMLSQPAAAAMVATIVHEATHQLACNTGLQARFSDTPFWVSEGLAIYFEAPDLKSRSGWRGIGNVNWVRLNQMRQYLSTRPANSLVTLLQDDQRFHDGREVLNAYSEAWALNHYLMTRHEDKYLDYLRDQMEKKPLVEGTAADRLEEFKRHFGEELSDLDEDFIRYVIRLR